MGVADIEFNGVRFICCDEAPSADTHHSVGAYPCKPLYEPESIRTGYALRGFFNMRMGCVYEDWLAEQPDDVQHIIEAYRAQDEGVISPVHYFFKLNADGKVTAVHFYLERSYYLKLPRL